MICRQRGDMLLIASGSNDAPNQALLRTTAIVDGLPKCDVTTIAAAG